MHNRSKTVCIRHEWASGGTKQLAEYILIFVIWDLNSAADDDLTRTTALLLPVVPFHPTAVGGATGPLPLPSSHRRPFSHRAESREDTAANKQAACVCARSITRVYLVIPSTKRTRETGSPGCGARGRDHISISNTPHSRMSFVVWIPDPRALLGSKQGRQLCGHCTCYVVPKISLAGCHVPQSLKRFPDK